MSEGFKAAPFAVKAAGPDDGLGEGVFEGYASVFGNVDSYGDIVDRGAFTETLTRWGEKGQIPVMWGHDMFDPYSTIGGVTEAVEDEVGLKVTCQLDMDNPKAAQVFRLLKGRRVNTMSFAYTTVKADEEDDGFHLKQLDLHEVSLVHVPANPEAQVTAVKDAARVLAKAGRVLSAKNETSLREARDAIDSALSSLEAENGKSAPVGGNSQGEASEAGEGGEVEANVEQPDGVVSTSVETGSPKASASVEFWAANFKNLSANHGGER